MSERKSRKFSTKQVDRVTFPPSEDNKFRASALHDTLRKDDRDSNEDVTPQHKSSPRRRFGYVILIIKILRTFALNFSDNY